MGKKIRERGTFWIPQKEPFYRKKSPALHPTPNLEDQLFVSISPSDRVAQLYPQAPGYPFVAFYDSQG
jgi:hypothetical protein